MIPGRSKWPFAPEAAPTPEAEADAIVAEIRSSNATTVEENPEHHSSQRTSVSVSKRTGRPRGGTAVLVWSGESVRQSIRLPSRRASGTHANIPGVPLPPATDEEGLPHYRLRRSESVIADALAAQRGLGRFHGLARRASSCMHEMIAGSLDLASLIGDGSIRAVRKFEAMPRQRQIMWVATPYAVVVVLVLVLVQLRDPESAAGATVVKPIPAQAQQQVVQIPVQQVQAPVELPPVAPPTPAREVAAPVVEGKLKGVVRTLPKKAWFRATPDLHGLKIARLKPDTRVTIFEQMPSAEGWYVAQLANSELGYIKTSVFDAEPQRKISKKKAPGKKKTAATASKRRASKKFDPIAELEKRR